MIRNVPIPRNAPLAIHLDDSTLFSIPDIVHESPVKRSTLRDHPSIVRFPFALRMQMNSRKFHCPFLFFIFESRIHHPVELEIYQPVMHRDELGVSNIRSSVVEYAIACVLTVSVNERASCKRILCNITELHRPG